MASKGSTPSVKLVSDERAKMLKWLNSNGWKNVTALQGPLSSFHLKRCWSIHKGQGVGYWEYSNIKAYIQATKSAFTLKSEVSKLKSQKNGLVRDIKALTEKKSKLKAMMKEVDNKTADYKKHKVKYEKLHEKYLEKEAERVSVYEKLQKKQKNAVDEMKRALKSIKAD